MEGWGQVIFVDDEEDVRLSGLQTLELAGFNAVAMDSAEPVLNCLWRDWPGVVVTDVKMPRIDGLNLMRQILAIDYDLPVVLLTAHGDISMAIQATRDGAYDFIEKPAPPDYLVDVVHRALEKRRLVLENRELREAAGSLEEMEGRIVGQAPSIVNLRRYISELAGTEVTVLVIGETGTGKELVARCLHDFSPRRERRFVPLNCGAIPENLIESELFGHEAGAFTGANKRRIGKVEYSHGGTLFLDEIESMPLFLQVKLLRVLQEQTVERLGSNEPIPVDIRVVAASKIDLLEATRNGKFREDLYYRLSVANITLPLLSQRREDIPLLFHHLSSTVATRYRRTVPEITAERITELMNRPWAGNVRELRNEAERFVLGLEHTSESSADKCPDTLAEGLSERVQNFEREVLLEALTKNDGRIGDTAEALQIPRKRLYLKMRKHGLKKEQFC